MSSREELLRIVMERGYRRLPEPIKLSSGEMSSDYVNAKRALADGRHLKLACETLLELTDEAGVTFDAVGGLTLGADQFAHVMAALSGKSWFVVRKRVKDHGTQSRVEGAVLEPGVSALLVDDVVTTGASILEALDVVEQTGATVAGAVTVVDRGEVAGEEFRRRGITYKPLFTYRDLGIEPVGSGGG